MDTAEGEDCRRLSEEDGEEDENNLFEEGDDLEGARMSPILEDIIRPIDYRHSSGNRPTEMTRLWAFELLRTCGSKVLNMVDHEFSVPSRQTLPQKPPSNYVQSDLIDFHRWLSGFGHGATIRAEKSVTRTVRGAF